MKIKNINLSFLLLAGLIFLSFAFYVGAESSSTETGNIFLDRDRDGLSDEEERVYGTNPDLYDTDGDSYSDGAEIKSGYDPTKPAPNDKLVFPAAKEETVEEKSLVLGDSTENENSPTLTEEVAQKITTVTAESASLEKGVTLENIEMIAEESLSGETSVFSEELLPEIKKEDLNIKEQNYAQYGEEKAKQMMREDFLDYTTAIFYIFSSNSPTPITSLSQMPSFFKSITTTLISAISKGNATELEAIAKSQEKILEQIEDIEVPEDLVDTHIKLLKFTIYSQQIPTLVQAKQGDPMGSISNLSKLEGYLTSLSEFVLGFQNQFSKYGLVYDESLRDRLNNLGIEAPEKIDSLFQELSDSQSASSEEESEAE